MYAPSRPTLLRRLWDNILLRVILYYLVLGAGLALVWHWLPVTARTALSKPLAELTGGGGLGRAAERLVSTGELPEPDQGTLALAVGIAGLSALLLSLPVSWVYILTRAKKGFRQSVVHTLVLLPLVVSGVVVMVKHSLALAFSLAGILAAVRFRNTLEDTKDASFLFLASAIGLASGVEVVIGAVMSVTFNIVILWLWFTDFGRTPAALEGQRARERMERLRQELSRTTSFVAAVDDELLKGMSPEQLDALADRAWRRRKRISTDFEDDEREEFRHLLRVRTMEPGALRERLEARLGSTVRRWRFGGVVHESDGTHVLEYGVELDGGSDEPTLLAELRAHGEPHVLALELR